MKVLILSVTAGYGHHATANAVQNMLIAKGAETEVIDIYEYINRTVQRTIDKGYLFSSKHTPELYRLCYTFAENRRQSYFSVAPFNMITLVNALGSLKFEFVIDSFAPDVIICTHVFAAQLINEMKRRNMVSAPTIGIITDYTLHPYWENVPHVEYIVTGSELLEYRAARKGISPDRLLHFGIPIHPKFNQIISKPAARAQLGIDPSIPTILMMGGSMGYSNNRKLIKSIAGTNLRVQILAVCGNNKKQHSQLVDMLPEMPEHCRLIPFGFVDNVEVMMSAADCIVTKPGGLTVSEALAKNLPMILVDPIPGHEERNVEFLVNNGIASLVTKTFTIDEAVFHLFKHPARLKTVQENTRAISHPDATERLADFVLTL